MNIKAYALGIVAFIWIASCSTKENKIKIEAYQVINPIAKDTVYTKEYVAEINALQNVEVRTRIKGFIESIYVDEGQFVQKGQRLFSISSKGFEQDLLKSKAATKSALADLKLAEIELVNAEKLLKKNVIADTEYEFAIAKVEVFKAKVQEARSEEEQASLYLSYAEVRAPFNGVINRIPHKTGSLVEEGTLLTSISNSNEVYAYFNVSEKEYLDLAAEHIADNSPDRYIKEEATLILANGEIYQHSGIIETSESEFDPATGNLAFRAKFHNPDGLLKHGGNGKIIIERPIKNALIIPQKSTFELQDKLYVYVLKSDSTLELRNITSSIRLPHLFVVDKGLHKEDFILYEGVQSVGEGEKIIPKRISLEDLQNFTF